MFSAANNHKKPLLGIVEHAKAAKQRGTVSCERASRVFTAGLQTVAVAALCCMAYTLATIAPHVQRLSNLAAQLPPGALNSIAPHAEHLSSLAMQVTPKDVNNAMHVLDTFTYVASEIESLSAQQLLSGSVPGVVDDILHTDFAAVATELAKITSSMTHELLHWREVNASRPPSVHAKAGPMHPEKIAEASKRRTPKHTLPSCSLHKACAEGAFCLPEQLAPGATSMDDWVGACVPCGNLMPGENHSSGGSGSASWSGPGRDLPYSRDGDGCPQPLNTLFAYDCCGAEFIDQCGDLLQCSRPPNWMVQTAQVTSQITSVAIKLTHLKPLPDGPVPSPPTNSTPKSTAASQGGLLLSFLTDVGSWLEDQMRGPEWVKLGQSCTALVDQLMDVDYSSRDLASSPSRTVRFAT
jgi:hypothetical protein